MQAAVLLVHKGFQLGASPPSRELIRIRRTFGPVPARFSSFCLTKAANPAQPRSHHAPEERTHFISWHAAPISRVVVIRSWVQVP